MSNSGYGSSVSNLTNNNNSGYGSSVSNLTNNNGYGSNGSNGSNMSNLTNNEGIFAAMEFNEFNEKFENDYKTIENTNGKVDAFKHAFYEFFQNFIDPEKLQVISKTFNGNNSDVIAFLYENINKLESKYKTNNDVFTKLSLEEQDDIDNYINDQSRLVVYSLLMSMGTQRGGKRRKKRKDKTRKQRKQRKTKRNKAKSKRRRTKRN